MAALLAAIGILYMTIGGTRNPAVEIGQGETARRLDYQVVGSYPHNPDAFLQGLLWYEDRADHVAFPTFQQGLKP